MALAALALVDGVGGESAPTPEVSLEGIWLEGELLAMPKPERLHAMGVRAVRGPASSGLLADEAATGARTVTGTVTYGQLVLGRLALDVELDRVHGRSASSGSGRLIQAGRGRPGGDGGLRTKRSGWAMWAAERMTARAA